MKSKFLMVLTLTILWLLSFAQSLDTNLSKQNLSQQEIQILLYMRQQAKLAYDLYYTFHYKWGIPIFYNIAKSENYHSSNFKLLIEKYHLNDPVDDLELGKYQDENLQHLYEELHSFGYQSIKNALIAGATIEDLTLSKVNGSLQKVDNEDVVNALRNYQNASKHHLIAFVRYLNRFGYIYTPKYLTEKQFNKIITRTKR